MKQQLTTNGILPLDGMEVMEDELMFVLGGASGHGESDSGCSCEARQGLWLRLLGRKRLRLRLRRRQRLRMRLHQEKRLTLKARSQGGYIFLTSWLFI